MSILNRLIDRFKDATYRRTYVDDFANAYLATQIQVLREQRGLTQTEFADLVGVRQSQVCRWENVNNSSWQLRTLRKIAAALDLVVVVRFESFGQVLPDIEAFSREALERVSFADDPAFRQDFTEAQINVVTLAGDSTSDEAPPCPIGPGVVINAEHRFRHYVYADVA